MKKDRELPIYTLLNPEFQTLEDSSTNSDYGQEKEDEMTNQDENQPNNEK